MVVSMLIRLPLASKACVAFGVRANAKTSVANEHDGCSVLAAFLSLFVADLLLELCLSKLKSSYPLLTPCHYIL